MIDAEGLAAMVRAVRGAVRDALRSGRFPLVVGADCPVLFGCVLGARDSGLDPTICFVDGHEDAYPPTASPTGEAADMELGLLLGGSGGPLPPALSGLPTVPGERIAVLGPRDGVERARGGVASIRAAVTYYADDLALRRDPSTVSREAVAWLVGRGPMWLHVDLDVLATDALAAVDCRQPGGLAWIELEAVESAVLTAGAIGWDVTIYNPDLDHGGAAASRIVRHLATALAG